MRHYCDWLARSTGLLVLSVLVPMAQGAGGSVLRSSGESFVIVQFADLHFGEAPEKLWGPEQDRNSTRVMESILDTEKPDLVVFSGDQLTGNNIRENATEYWRQIVQPCVDRGVRWAQTFGNHDDMPLDSVTPSHEWRVTQSRRLSSTSRSELMEFDRSFALSQSKSDFASSEGTGLSNFHLQIGRQQSGPSENTSADEKSDACVPLVVWFLDSGGGSMREIVSEDEVVWLKEEGGRIRERDRRKRCREAVFLLFVHIPLPQYADLHREPRGSGGGEFASDASEGECWGSKEDGIAPTEEDTRLFRALKDLNFSAVSVGHNHGNDFCCPKDGVVLCYGRHTGYGGYGTWERGARVLRFFFGEEALETWVRFEDGRKKDERWILAPPRV
uniref:Calcineurin-like phosphoesterase domain-containing protein n=1 Tax=Chromera velia CCMP2878 TaxID=1169474 RepID=A0A0G4GVY3_9ALVE|eukprot:Cvel_23630.t1-p1 / transcript=Cvel_23630.t1 / gene=Cvel_23630 / organism=Chromera_velia_CCMP2878 / gene_product=Probable inactive purple acid phosphatase 16, putative / transcript_product=Probable inactive purple acid phosphatase 16, putative / location=Cvel_scaffold2457:1520-2680(-) / protein_length=387 / sequence_SO=supercontig / SO=protein_coding / is_pseudo=false